MEDKEYLDEERYQRFRKVFLILAVIGIVVFIIGLIVLTGLKMFVPDMGQDGWFEAESKKNFTCFGGGACMMFGAALAIGCFTKYFRRNLAGLAAQERMPIYTEAINKGADNISPAIRSVASSIRSSSNFDEKENELERVKLMRDRGSITEEEYQKLRKKILGL